MHTYQGHNTGKQKRVCKTIKHQKNDSDNEYMKVVRERKFELSVMKVKRS